VSYHETVASATIADYALHYEKMGACLFPLQPGTKEPFKDFKWKELASRDPAQWRAWGQQFPGCNWAMYALASGLIVIDIDVKNVGREKAWAEYEKLCAKGGGPTIQPHVSTPSGGWHVYTKIPADVNPFDLSQRVLVKGIIETRINGYVVIPPSVIGGGSYATYH
jgi:hypothetical protein